MPRSCPRRPRRASRRPSADELAKAHVIVTTALIPCRPAPVLITEDVVQRMRPGSVIVDLAAANGGNCPLTVPDEVVQRHGVTLIGHTNYPSMVAGRRQRLLRQEPRQSARHHDGQVRCGPGPQGPGAGRDHQGHAGAPLRPRQPRPSALAEYSTMTETMALYVFVLACFIGYYVIWGVTPALHTPLVALTNAISGIVIVGALLVTGLEHVGTAAELMGFLAVLLASINVFGGFLVTHRMLSMFNKKKK